MRYKVFKWDEFDNVSLETILNNIAIDGWELKFVLGKNGFYTLIFEMEAE